MYLSKQDVRWHTTRGNAVLVCRNASFRGGGGGRWMLTSMLNGCLLLVESLMAADELVMMLVEVVPLSTI